MAHNYNYYILFFNPQRAGFGLPVDKKVNEKIEQLFFNEKVRKVGEISRHLDNFVKEEFPYEISKNNRGYFPLSKDISNKINRCMNLAGGKDDQGHLDRFVEDWKKEEPNANFLFRPNLKDNDDPFLFCYQNQFHKHLLKRYGNEAILLDSTHKVTKYQLSLFFIVVPTNSSFQVAGFFLTTSETQSAITEALQVFKEWNVHLSPQFSMVDFCLEEIDALETVFPGRLIIIFT